MDIPNPNPDQAQNEVQNEAQQVNIDRIFNNPFNLDPEHEDIRIDRKMDRDIFLPLFAVEPFFGIENNYYSIESVNPIKESFFHFIESLLFPNATFYQISIILCYIITVVYIITISFGQDETVSTISTVKISILDKFGSFYPKKIKEKYWNLYRLITFNFLHLNFPHLLINIVCLISFCSLFEELVKKRCFLLIFFLNGIFTNLTGLIIYEKNERFCGINLGINGIFGSYIMLFALNWDELKPIFGPFNFIFTLVYLGLFIFCSMILLFSRNIMKFSIYVLSLFYGALLCGIIVKPIKKENWKLYTRIGSGVLILSLSIISFVLFILK